MHTYVVVIKIIIRVTDGLFTKNTAKNPCTPLIKPRFVKIFQKTAPTTTIRETLNLLLRVCPVLTHRRVLELLTYSTGEIAEGVNIANKVRYTASGARKRLFGRGASLRLRRSKTNLSASTPHGLNQSLNLSGFRKSCLSALRISTAYFYLFIAGARPVALRTH